MTIRNLRRVLYEINDQFLTISQLRKLLYEVKDQDDEYKDFEISEIIEKLIKENQEKV